ncbi:hypothetical protein T484DRAFT_1888159 [Baffinella frigidus]|nr:hypothetical protein T484DRAFT_1888159 [Cryptophyta sp. CCMP2293]
MSGPQHSSSTKRMLAMMPEPAAWETPSGPGGAATSESTESRSAAWRGLSSSSGRKASLRDDELRGESPNEGPVSPALGKGTAAVRAQMAAGGERTLTTPRYMEAESIGGSAVSYTNFPSAPSPLPAPRETRFSQREHSPAGGLTTCQREYGGLATCEHGALSRSAPHTPARHDGEEEEEGMGAAPLRLAFTEPRAGPRGGGDGRGAAAPGVH